MILQLKNISKSYISNNEELRVLNSINLELNSGETLAITGDSGCGKTTLLQIIGLLDDDYSGELIIDGIDVKNITNSEKIKIKANTISHIHQFHHLFPEFNALENVIIPMLNLGINMDVAKNKAIDILQQVGLKDFAFHNIWKLSGGQRQRVAIARALATNPKIILADEPTGNLDPENSEIVMNLLLDMSKKFNSALMLVTHNIELAKKCSKVMKL